jgi:phosphohistidine phosphatase SixA
MSHSRSKKEIFIVRHGHSNFSERIDFDRKLNSKGIIAVEKTARFIDQICKSQGLCIDMCISSAALRTKQTSKIIAGIIDIKQQSYHRELYSTVASKWLDMILNQSAKTVIIVGHNPTFSQMVNNLCGRSVYMQPADCAHISLEFKSDGIIYPATLNNFYKNE